MRLGLGLSRSANGGGGVVPVGATYVWVGDGIVANTAGAGRGPGNCQEQFHQLMSGRVQPVAVPNLGKSGTRIKTSSGSQYAWVYPYAIDAAYAQRPDIFIIGSMGHNDNVMGTNPGTNPASGFTTSAPLQDWYDAVSYAYSKFTSYSGRLFVVVGTFPSDIANETVVDAGQTDNRRTRVWQAQSDHVAAITASDSRVIFVSLAAALPPGSFSTDPANSNTHPDERGGYFMANAVKAIVDAKVESKTPDQIADMIVAGTYPLMSGSQIDTDVVLTGTGGTITGPGVTGTIATSKKIINSTGATGITVSQVATSGGRTKTVVDFSAATVAGGGGRLYIQDKSNISLATTPGQSIVAGAIMRASAGYWNFGADYGVYGGWCGTAASLGDNTLIGAAETHALSALVMTTPFPLYNTSTFAAQRAWGLYWRASTALSGTFEIERPFAYLVSERTRHPPTYLADVADANGAFLFGSSQRIRPTGTVTNSSGGTVRVEPGLWTPRGLTESDFAARRIYAGGGAGSANIGAGTLLATLTGSTWTYAVSAGAVAAGVLIYVEVDANNGIGSQVTARSNISITVGA